MKLSKSDIVLSIIIAMLLIIISAFVYKDFSHRGSDNGKESLTVSDTESNKPTGIETKSQLQKYKAAIELDEEYNRRMANAQSNVEITQINSEFADKWKAEIDKNYQNLLSVSWKYLREKLTASQAEWYIYAEKRLDEQYEYLFQKYTTGTALPLNMSKFQYDLYRERAIELFLMYDDLKNEDEAMEKSWQEHWESVRGEE